MTLTLLIDLDDTLLDNPMESFLPAYTQALGKHLADLLPPGEMIAALMEGTRQMFANQRPDRTLETVFAAYFFPRIGIPEETLRPRIETFYAEVFPGLQSTTRPRPAALTLMQTAFQRGYRVAIATNPVFPRTAILQRLRWAGLDPAEDPIAIIPSMESFHFAKPNPAYFAELLTWLGWPKSATVMVGDDPSLDIDGGRKMGLPAYWVHPPGASFPAEMLPPTGEGSIGATLAWIEGRPPEALTPDYADIPAILATLRGGPAAMSSMVAPLPAERWQQRPEPEEWCLTEILCHLRDVEREVNLPRLKAILNEDTPFIVGVDSDAWATERDYRSQDGAAALGDFLQARLETLALLDELKAGDWQRPAQHAIFGPTTLRELFEIIARHERLHLRQIHKTLHKLQNAQANTG